VLRSSDAQCAVLPAGLCEPIRGPLPLLSTTVADPVSMRRPTEIDIVRKAYELWELSGKPEGRDQEFYLEALQELQAALDDQAPEQPE
jgi:hypothetical protein